MKLDFNFKQKHKNHHYFGVDTFTDQTAEMAKLKFGLSLADIIL